MQCGIASLAMICQYFGKRYSIDELQDICFATTEGVSMLGICQAARTLGLDCMAGRVSVEQLIENGMPCILHWNQNHFVVLYKVSKGRKFYIADPGKGKITYTPKARRSAGHSGFFSAISRATANISSKS